MKKQKCASITPAKALELMINWQKVIPSELYNLFTYETKDKLHRYTAFDLDKKCIPHLVYLNDLKKSKKGKGVNIKTISFVMGAIKHKTKQIFQPLIKVVLRNPYRKQRTCFFLLQPVTSFTTTVRRIVNKQSSEGLSPKVAQLFILNWETLTNDGIVDAFQGLAAAAIANPNDDSTLEVTFGNQKLLPVKEYTFDPVETASMLEDLTKGEKGKTSFTVHLGSSLRVADFHPFNFRPVVQIVSIKNTVQLPRSKKLRKAQQSVKSPVVDSTATESYYDTSRPCPPFCSSTPLDDN